MDDNILNPFKTFYATPQSTIKNYPVSVVTKFTTISNLNYATFTSYFSAISNADSTPTGISFSASPSTSDNVGVKL